MNHKEQMSADHLALFNLEEFGEEIVYGNNQIVAIIDREVQPDIGTRVGADYVMVQISTSSIVIPNIHDVLYFDDKAWAVQRVVKSDPYIWSLLCHAKEGVAKF